MPLPAVNPYNKDEIEYQEPGFDYAPKYPGSYDYNESGIQYREAGFPYVKRDATVSASTVACSADLSLTFAYVYTPQRPGGIDYSTGYDYNESGFNYNERDNSIPDNRVLVDYSQSGVTYSQPTDNGFTVVVTATPAAIAVTTAFSAGPSVPATVEASTVAATTTFPALDVDGNYVVVQPYLEVTATFPAPDMDMDYTAQPSAIAATGTFPGHTMYITVDATPAVIAAAATFPAVDVDGNVTIELLQPIQAVTAVPELPIYRLLVMPSTMTLPPVGNPEDATPAAYALRRHFAQQKKGTNVFIVNGSSVQTFLPADQSTVTRWIYGGHESPKDLTAAEATVLVDAGYSIEVGAGA